MTIEKRKAIKITAIVLAVLTIFAAIFTAIYFVRQDSPAADNTLNVETENGFCKNSNLLFAVWRLLQKV